MTPPDRTSNAPTGGSSSNAEHWYLNSLEQSRSIQAGIWRHPREPSSHHVNAIGSHRTTQAGGRAVSLPVEIRSTLNADALIEAALKQKGGTQPISLTQMSARAKFHQLPPEWHSSLPSRSRLEEANLTGAEANLTGAESTHLASRSVSTPLEDGLGGRGAPIDLSNADATIPTTAELRAASDEELEAWYRASMHWDTPLTSRASTPRNSAPPFPTHRPERSKASADLVGEVPEWRQPLGHSPSHAAAGATARLLDWIKMEEEQESAREAWEAGTPWEAGARASTRERASAGLEGSRREPWGISRQRPASSLLEPLSAAPDVSRVEEAELRAVVDRMALERALNELQEEIQEELPGHATTAAAESSEDEDGTTASFRQVLYDQHLAWSSARRALEHTDQVLDVSRQTHAKDTAVSFEVEAELEHKRRLLDERTRAAAAAKALLIDDVLDDPDLEGSGGGTPWLQPDGDRSSTATARRESSSLDEREEAERLAEAMPPTQRERRTARGVEMDVRPDGATRRWEEAEAPQWSEDGLYSRDIADSGGPKGTGASEATLLAPRMNAVEESASLVTPRGMAVHKELTAKLMVMLATPEEPELEVSGEDAEVNEETTQEEEEEEEEPKPLTLMEELDSLRDLSAATRPRGAETTLVGLTGPSSSAECTPVGSWSERFAALEGLLQSEGDASKAVIPAQQQSQVASPENLDLAAPCEGRDLMEWRRLPPASVSGVSDAATAGAGVIQLQWRDEFALSLQRLEAGMERQHEDRQKVARAAEYCRTRMRRVALTSWAWAVSLAVRLSVMRDKASIWFGGRVLRNIYDQWRRWARQAASMHAKRELAEGYIRARTLRRSLKGWNGETQYRGWREKQTALGEERYKARTLTVVLAKWCEVLRYRMWRAEQAASGAAKLRTRLLRRLLRGMREVVRYRTWREAQAALGFAKSRRIFSRAAVLQWQRCVGHKQQRRRCAERASTNMQRWWQSATVCEWRGVLAEHKQKRARWMQATTFHQGLQQELQRGAWYFWRAEIVHNKQLSAVCRKLQSRGADYVKAIVLFGWRTHVPTARALRLKEASVAVQRVSRLRRSLFSTWMTLERANRHYRLWLEQRGLVAWGEVCWRVRHRRYLVEQCEMRFTFIRLRLCLEGWWHLVQLILRRRDRFTRKQASIRIALSVGARIANQRRRWLLMETMAAWRCRLLQTSAARTPAALLSSSSMSPKKSRCNATFMAGVFVQWQQIAQQGAALNAIATGHRRTRQLARCLRAWRASTMAWRAACRRAVGALTAWRAHAHLRSQRRAALLKLLEAAACDAAEAAAMEMWGSGAGGRGHFSVISRRLGTAFGRWRRGVSGRKPLVPRRPDDSGQCVEYDGSTAGEKRLGGTHKPTSERLERLVYRPRPYLDSDSDIEQSTTLDVADDDCQAGSMVEGPIAGTPALQTRVSPASPASSSSRRLRMPSATCKVPQSVTWPPDDDADEELVIRARAAETLHASDDDSSDISSEDGSGVFELRRQDVDVQYASSEMGATTSHSKLPARDQSWEAGGYDIADTPRRGDEDSTLTNFAAAISPVTRSPSKPILPSPTDGRAVQEHTPRRKRQDIQLPPGFVSNLVKNAAVRRSHYPKAHRVPSSRLVGTT
ncbi:hypothetical protein CYMTET_50437 [Cymbomonas tetramitiformis]|uniref:Sfi1 spindle body domain-containing protein n=1 Tax=Cymbomonas tetramitiformis TaxID=36881 RepID=A0AAE0BPS5_9CHLO|nr:hypothetical protein CYMTET_50437 [Cymbomonas tetramitiformis]